MIATAVPFQQQAHYQKFVCKHAEWKCTGETRPWRAGWAESSDRNSKKPNEEVEAGHFKQKEDTENINELVCVRL